MVRSNGLIDGQGGAVDASVDKFIYREVNSDMPSTVRISDRGHALLGQLAQQTGSTMTEVLDAALENYRRRYFLEQANRAYAALADSATESKDYQEELKTLDSTLGDGLERYPP